MLNSDLNNVKFYKTLCVASGSTCFVRVASSLITDMAGNNVVALTDRPITLTDYAEFYQPDITPQGS